MNLKDLFGGSEDNKKSVSAPKSNIMLILIIVFVLLCLIGYFIYKANKFVGTGGILITAGPYNYHVFTKNDSIKYNTTGQIDYLIIGGGGSGGNVHGGGGGAGRVISGTIDVTGISYPIVVGNGGIQPIMDSTTIGYDRPVTIDVIGYNIPVTIDVIGKSYPIVVGNGGIQPIMNSTQDCKGQDSSAFGVNAEGGGYGGGAGTGPASSGGSGGGGAGYITGNNKPVINGGIANGSNGLGNKGGDGNADLIAGGGGGGGGSNSSGENGLLNRGDLTAQGGKGGLGTNKYSEWLNVIKNNMPQTWKDAIGIGYIAAGGGGGSWATEIQLGGNGGGGNGGSWQGSGSNVKLNIDPTKGVQNTGSGGGGGGSNNRLGAPGGSGLVIIRYKN